MRRHNKNETQRGTYYWYRENVLSCGTQRAPANYNKKLGQQRSAEQSTGIRPSFSRDEKKPPFGGL